MRNQPWINASVKGKKEKLKCILTEARRLGRGRFCRGRCDPEVGMWLSLNDTFRFYLYLYTEQNKDSACVVDPGQAARIREVGVRGNEGELRRVKAGLSERATKRLSLPSIAVRTAVAWSDRWLHRKALLQLISTQQPFDTEKGERAVASVGGVRSEVSVWLALSLPPKEMVPVSLCTSPSVFLCPTCQPRQSPRPH